MALQRFTVPSLLVAALAVAPACGDSAGGGDGGAPGTGGATSTGPGTGSVVASSAVGSTASSGGDGGATTITSASSGGDGGDGGGATGSTASAGGDGGATTSTASSGADGGGGEAASTTSSGGDGGGGRAGAGGAGGDGSGGDGGDSSVSSTSSSSTSSTATSTSTASSSSSGGGENCVAPPVVDPRGPLTQWVEVPGLCANDQPGRMFPFTVTVPTQATISRGHTLYTNPPYERSALFEGCEHPGPITPVDFSGQSNPPGLLFEAHHCRTQSMELQPGTYAFACCQCSSYFSFLLEDPPPPPTNTTCETAAPLLASPGEVHPRIVDDQPRYYRYDLAQDLPAGQSSSLAFDSVGQQSGNYYQRVIVTDGCDGPVLRDTTTAMCTNGVAYVSAMPETAGSYVVRVSNIDPGTQYRIYLTTSP